MHTSNEFYANLCFCDIVLLGVQAVLYMMLEITKVMLWHHGVHPFYLAVTPLLKLVLIIYRQKKVSLAPEIIICFYNLMICGALNADGIKGLHQLYLVNVVSGRCHQKLSITNFPNANKTVRKGWFNLCLKCCWWQFCHFSFHLCHKIHQKKKGLKTFVI